jgi:hypothetical protein
MSKIFLDILDEGRKEVFEKLSVFSEYGYLAGGTALALQIGHRQSVDFDVFTYKPLAKSLITRIKTELHPKETLLNQQDQYSFSVEHGIEITFIWFEQKLLDSVIPTSSLSLASIRDIAANKAYTVGRRALWRDYVDIFWILKYGYLTLSDIIDSAKRKYEIDFVETQFLEQLGYFADVSVVPIQYIKNSYDPEEIQKHLLSQVQTYVQAEFDKQQSSHIA